MGIMKLSNRRMYWTPNHRNDPIAESMTQKWFDEIMMVEQVVSFKGKHNLRQYLPKNPEKVGI